MENNIVQQLEDAFDVHGGSRYESDVSVLGDYFEIRGRVEDIGLQKWLFFFIIGVPAGMLILERSFLFIFFALVWLAVFGIIFIEITKGDIITRFDVVGKTLEVTNINPIITKIRGVFRIRYSWEGQFEWSLFRQILLREKRYSRWISERGYRLVLRGTDKREYLIAEFASAVLAEKVAFLLARLTGTQYMKIRA